MNTLLEIQSLNLFYSLLYIACFETYANQIVEQLGPEKMIGLH